MSRSRVLGQIFWFHGGLIALEVVERKNRSGYTTKIIPGLYCEKNTDLGYMPKKDPQLDGEKQAQGLRCQIVEHPRRGGKALLVGTWNKRDLLPCRLFCPECC